MTPLPTEVSAASSLNTPGSEERLEPIRTTDIPSPERRMLDDKRYINTTLYFSRFK